MLELEEVHSKGRSMKTSIDIAWSLTLKMHNHFTATRAILVSTIGISHSFGCSVEEEVSSYSTLIGTTCFTRAIKRGLKTKDQMEWKKMMKNFRVKEIPEKIMSIKAKPHL